MGKFGLPVYGPGEHSTDNKTLIIGEQGLKEYQNDDGIYEISKVINNRVVVLLDENEVVARGFIFPSGTNVTFIATKDVTKNRLEVHYTPVHSISSKAYGVKGAATIDGAKNSYNKNCDESEHGDIAGDVLNQNIHGRVHSGAIRGNTKNINIGGDCIVDRSDPTYHGGEDAFKNVKGRVKIMNDLEHLFED